MIRTLVIFLIVGATVSGHGQNSTRYFDDHLMTTESDKKSGRYVYTENVEVGGIKTTELKTAKGNKVVFKKIWKDGQPIGTWNIGNKKGKKHYLIEVDGLKYADLDTLINPSKEGATFEYASVNDQKELMRYLRKNIKYPSVGTAEKIEGRVHVALKIDNSGNVVDGFVVESIHPALDLEALTVVQGYRQFKPATLGGVPVESYFSLPIHFRLK